MIQMGRATALRVLGASLTVRAAALMVLLVSTTTPAAGQGRIANAKIETRQISQTLEREIQAIAERGAAVWVGYRTPMIAGQRHMCCSACGPSERACASESERGWGPASIGKDSASLAGCCGRCRLESGDGITMTVGDWSAFGSDRIVIEPPSEMLILARLESRTVTRIRTFTPDCDLDAGAMPVVWFENVPPADSVAWLTALIGAAAAGSDRDNHVVQPAIAALALHPGQPALRTLIALARSDERSGVRSQALFWLAQRAGQEAAAAITDAITNDPETEVKRRAVFALSQLPRDEGIPLLVNVARTNRNAEVRRQAMFWLGQSKDPRAIGLFEEILKIK